ncbi:MAG: HAD family phosphatase [Bacteroidales bacterium]
MKEYKNIVFDLGQVLLPIDFDAPVKAFRKLGMKDFDGLYQKTMQADLFNLLETGMITEQQFRDEMRRIAGKDWSDQEIDDAWGTIILDFRPETIDMLEKLGKTHRLFLLSNTNSIHYKRYNSLIKRKFCSGGLDAYFEKCFYSHKMGLRKPDPKIFRKVQQEADILISDTLFVDDNIENIRVAKKEGYQTLHLTPNVKVENVIGCP